MYIVRTFRKALLMVAVLVSCSLPVTVLAGDYTIDHYKPGKIVVNGQTYKNDIVILPDGTIQAAPKDMHYVLLSELENIINLPGIKTLVIGTGREGNGSLSADLVKIVEGKGIQLKMLRTKDAIKFLNDTPKAGVVAMLHLNC